MYPINAKISTPYGKRGKWWSLDRNSAGEGKHTGDDFAAPKNTVIRAVQDGKIIFAGKTNSYGYLQIIEHVVNGVRYRGYYAHQTKFKRKSGSVKAGEHIGYVGSTGNSTGNHLHFEVRKPGYGFNEKDIVNPKVLYGSTDKMSPASYHEGAVGSHVTWLGERLVAHGYDGYDHGPGPRWGEKDRKGVRLFQEAQGWTGEDADGYPGRETLRRLAADPKVTPAPPKPKTTEVVSYVLNVAGLNAHGARTVKSRLPLITKGIWRVRPDVANFQEANVASKTRGLLDSGLAGLMKRLGGGHSRYCYLNNDLEYIAGGLITVASKHWYQRDDKQAGWVIYRKDGISAMDVTAHLEHESGAVADKKRVDQAINIMQQASKIATQHGVLWRNVLISGDMNSEGMVVNAMAKKGWINVAKGGSLEHYGTFTGWDGRSRKRFDYGFVHSTCKDAKLLKVWRDTSKSDHAALLIRRTLEIPS